MIPRILENKLKKTESEVSCSYDYRAPGNQVNLPLFKKPFLIISIIIWRILKQDCVLRKILRNCFYPEKKKIIIDEIQRIPTLLSYIQIQADQQKINGQFIITGSQSLLLSKQISQSLAGRTAVLKTTTFQPEGTGSS